MEKRTWDRKESNTATHYIIKSLNTNEILDLFITQFLKSNTLLQFIDYISTNLSAFPVFTNLITILYEIDTIIIAFIFFAMYTESKRGN